MKIIKILNYIFPLIIGALCSYMGSLTPIGKNNILQIIMIFTLSVIFSILLFYDAKTELDKLQKSYHNNYSNIMIIPELSEPPVRTLGATIPENESHIFR